MVESSSLIADFYCAPAGRWQQQCAGSALQHGGRVSSGHGHRGPRQNAGRWLGSPEEAAHGHCQCRWEMKHLFVTADKQNN